MATATHAFLCRSCGALYPKWMGKCSDCGAWDALEEHRITDASAHMDHQRGTAERHAGPEAPQATPITKLTTPAAGNPGSTARLSTGIGELDRVLGSAPVEVDDTLAAGNTAERGLVPGSAVLVGGDPGIGKSTLMLQAAHQLSQQGHRVLYVSSEESAPQLQLRARRLGAIVPGPCQLYVLADTNLARIVEQVHKSQPKVLVVDSIQMIYKGDLPAAPGTVTQLRTCCLELVYLAKNTGCAVLFVGHVTKQGQLAGPRLLEHMVDTVLYFEGDRYHSHRIVRAVKNRFGTTLEVGLFQMTDQGLEQVTEGTGLLATQYRPSSGSVVCPAIQGTRCLMVELQALTAASFPGTARRKTNGLDPNRLAMLIAVLEKHGGHRLADQDIFASSVGGIRMVEPATDLALALAIAGTHLNRRLTAPDGDCNGPICAVGEIGLGGEVRHVPQLDQRLREAARLGFTHVVCPHTTNHPPHGCQPVTVDRLDQALQLLN